MDLETERQGYGGDIAYEAGRRSRRRTPEPRRASSVLWGLLCLPAVVQCKGCCYHRGAFLSSSSSAFLVVGGPRPVSGLQSLYGRGLVHAPPRSWPPLQQAQWERVDKRVTTRLGAASAALRDMATQEVVSRLLMGTLAGALIGFERRYSERPAGIRTMALVSLGACIFTMISVYGLGGDQSRIAANVASGVGFIGAGVISQTSVKEGPKMGVRQINGLTTATAIWVSAALGVSSGAGLHVLTLTGAILAVAVLRMARLVRILKVVSTDVLRVFQGKASILSKKRSSGSAKQRAAAAAAVAEEAAAAPCGPSPIGSGMPSAIELYETTATMGLGSRDPADAPSRYDGGGGSGGSGGGGFTVMSHGSDDLRPEGMGLGMQMGSSE